MLNKGIKATWLEESEQEVDRSSSESLEKPESALKHLVMLLNVKNSMLGLWLVQMSETDRSQFYQNLVYQNRQYET